MTNEELIKLGYEMLGETEGEIKIPPMKPMREFIKTSIKALKFVDNIEKKDDGAADIFSSLDNREITSMPWE